MQKEESCAPKSTENCLEVAQPEEDQCAILFQETKCVSCGFDPINVSKHAPYFSISGLSRISSIALRDGCNVEAYGTSTIDGKEILNNFNKGDSQKLYADINVIRIYHLYLYIFILLPYLYLLCADLQKFAYNIKKFRCICNDSDMYEPMPRGRCY